MRTKTILIVLILLFSTALMNGCGSTSTPGTNSQNSSSSTSAASFKTIDAAAAKKMMDSGDPYTLVDVRTQAEYDAQHIKGAKLIPVDVIATEAAAKLPDKNATILLYCRSGVRAGQAAQTLAGLGYTKVYSFGGIINWPYGTVTGSN